MHRHYNISVGKQKAVQPIWKCFLCEFAKNIISMPGGYWQAVNLWMNSAMKIGGLFAIIVGSAYNGSLLSPFPPSLLSHFLDDQNARMLAMVVTSKEAENVKVV